MTFLDAFIHNAKMDAISELTRIRGRLKLKLLDLEAEIDAVDRAIGLLEAEQSLSNVKARSRRFVKMGLSEACREIIGSDYITPIEVRDMLRQGGYPKSAKSKLLNSVYATLKRLTANDFEKGKVNGKTVFRKPASGPIKEAGNK